MDRKDIAALHDRTDAKLRYARVHLDELANHEPLAGDDFDRAHQESFLFHLLGAQAALIAELNAYYGAGVAPESVSVGSLRKALIARGKSSAELAELHALEHDEASWYSQAKSMRDHSTHHRGVRRAFHLGGQNDRKVFLTVPKTDRVIERHFPLEFHNWLSSMEALVTKLRTSAISTTSQ